MDGTKVKHRLARLAQHSNRSLFIKFLQISRLWSPQTCHFLQRSPSMTTQLGRKYLMKWRRSADQTLSLRPLLPHIWRERERERECYMLRPRGLEVWLLLRLVLVELVYYSATVQRLSGPQVSAGDKTAALECTVTCTPLQSQQK